jgi:hypothetical protein
LLRALPGNGRNLTPSSPRYFRGPVGHTKEQSGFRRTTRLGPARKRRCRWGTSPPRSAPRSVVVYRNCSPSRASGP